MKRLFLALLAMMALASAYEVNFPAISDNNGTIVLSSINCEPGKGDGLELSLPPSFDKNALDSIINAYQLAKQKTGRSCQSTISFSKDEGQIEGPSGGMQFHLFYYSVLSGKAYPNDIIASGEIEEKGNVYPVGGEYEKAKAAKDNSYRYFITRPSSIYDYYMLSTLNDTGFHVVFVSTLSDARYFLDTGKDPKFDFSYLIQTPIGVNRTCIYNASWLGKYDEWMKEDFRAQMAETKMPNELKEAYKESFNRSLELEKKGYYYTAANYMFLNLENIRAFNRMVEKRSIDRSGVDACIAGYSGFSPNYETYELYAGAISRFERANELKFDTEDNISSTRFANAYSLEESLLWCRLAQELYNDSVKGNDVNTEVLRSALQPRLYNFSYSGDDVERARRLFIADEYLASYYELSYFISAEIPKPELKNAYNTKWGNAFAGQAYYLNMTGQSYADSASLANYMEEMPHYLLQGGTNLSGGKNPETGDRGGAQLAQEARESGFKTLTVLMAIALALAIAYAIANIGDRCRSHGDKRKGR
jgi:hypothetical protein